MDNFDTDLECHSMLFLVEVDMFLENITNPTTIIQWWLESIKLIKSL